MAHVGDKNVQFGVADVRTFVVSGSEESVREDIDRDSDRDSSGSDELLITTAQKSIRKRSDFHKMAHDDTYKKLVADGKRHMHSAAVSFPDGWDVQLIVDCGYNFAGHRIILFASQFLSPYVDDDDEMNRIVQYCLMRMDEIATRENYIFVLCGCEWSKPSVAQKIRFAIDILPPSYLKHLRQCILLHSTKARRLLLWTLRPLISSRFWGKIEHTGTIEQLCSELCLDDPAEQESLRRQFPQCVQRQDAQVTGAPMPHTFGMAIDSLCSCFGLDFTDRKTGRWYRRLPAPIILLCETLERQAADGAFASLFNADAEATYALVAAVDEGQPLDRDTPSQALWAVLKLFVDCLPSPLLSFDAFTELLSSDLAEDNIQGQMEFLDEFLNRRLSDGASGVALYLASFLHTMCETSRTSSQNAPAERKLTFRTAAEVFAAGFMRPAILTDAHLLALPRAVAIIETLVARANDCWQGRPEDTLVLTQELSCSSWD